MDVSGNGSMNVSLSQVGGNAGRFGLGQSGAAENNSGVSGAAKTASSSSSFQAKPASTVSNSVDVAGAGGIGGSGASSGSLAEKGSGLEGKGGRIDVTA